MTKKKVYTDKPIGDVEVIADFLPPPAELAVREDGVKVTLSLSKSKSFEKQFDEGVDITGALDLSTAKRVLQK